METYKNNSESDIQEILDDSFELNSENPESLLQKALQLSESGDIAQAKILAKILLLSIPTAEIYFQIGKLYHSISEEKEAIKCFENAVSQEPEETNYLDEYARFLCSISQYGKCENLLFSRISKGKSNVTVYYWLGETFRLQGKIKAAQISYLMALSLSPEDLMLRLAIITLASEIDSSKEFTSQFYQNAMEACINSNVEEAIANIQNAIMMTSVKSSTENQPSEDGLDVLLAAIKKAGDINTAMKEFISLSDKAITPQKIILLAKIKFVEKENDQALQIIKDGMQKFPEDEELPYYYAQNLEKRSINEALEFLESKIDDFPTSFQIRSYCGKLQLENGKNDLALKNLSRAFQINPDNSENNNLLIEACQKTNNLTQAIEIVRNNVLKQGESEESFLLLGNLLAQMHNTAEASTYFEMAQKKNPKSAKGVLAQARMFLNNEMLRDANIVLRQALPQHQNNPEFLIEYADVLQIDGQLIDASNIYRKILASDNNNVLAKNRLADILVFQGEYFESARYYRDLINLDSNNSNLMLALAEVYELSGNAKEAQELYKKAAEKNTNGLKAKEKLAICHLRQENFSQGIVAYEIISSTNLNNQKFTTPVPIWQGEPIEDKVLVVYQNLSDAETIMFVRYLPYIKKMGVKLELLVNSSLVRLLHPFADVVVDHPRYADFSLPLSAIPKIFNINLERIPNSRPYLTPDQLLMEKWHKLFANSKKNRVGIVWRSEKPKTEITNYDRISSIELSSLNNLIRKNTNYDFVSFQTGEVGINEEQSMSLPMRAGGQLSDDWADLACGISFVDLIITTDQTVAHIAGALGVKGIVLLPAMASWYWFTDRDQSPWYPSLQVARQTVMGDWNPLMTIVKNQLSQLAQAA